MFETIRSRRLDPEAERELEVIDLAVSQGETGRPEDAELTDFALKFRSARPVPDAGEIARLDSRVAHFSDGAGVSAPRRNAHRPRNFALAGLAAICVFGVSAVTFATLNSGEGVVSTFSERAVGTDDSMAVNASGAPEAAVQKRAGAENLQSLPGVDSAARVETRTTNLTLAAPIADVEQVSDDVIAVTDRYGGYVSSSKVDSGVDEAEASLELMIPAADYQAALAAISGLAHVRERVQNTEDITAPYRSAEYSLDRAIKNRNRLSRQRDAATAQAERDALTIRLRRAIRRVAAERQQFNALSRQVSYVAMSVAVVGDDAAEKSDESTIGAAWRISKDLLTKIAGALIVIVAVLLPFALLGLSVFFGTRVWRRRREDSVIGASSPGEQPAQSVNRNG